MEADVGVVQVGWRVVLYGAVFLTIRGVRIAGFVRRRTSCGAIFEGWDDGMGWRRVEEGGGGCGRRGRRRRRWAEIEGDRLPSTGGELEGHRSASEGGFF
jgi:hypothetical protein